MAEKSNKACAHCVARQAQLDEARAERDEARAERDEARAERDEARAEVAAEQGWNEDLQEWIEELKERPVHYEYMLDGDTAISGIELSIDEAGEQLREWRAMAERAEVKVERLRDALDEIEKLGLWHGTEINAIARRALGRLP